MGPVLFIIYINVIGSGITSNIGKYANDIKIERTIRIGEDTRALQDDLNKPSAWSDKWQISFNIPKCSVLSVGTRNPIYGYSLDSTVIGRTDYERDLGVLVNSDLNLRKQCVSARNKTNRVIGFINRTTIFSPPRWSGKIWAVFPTPSRPCSPSSE